MYETRVFDNEFTGAETFDNQTAILNLPWTYTRDVSGVDGAYPSMGFSHLFKHPDRGVTSPFYESVAVPIANRIIKLIETNYDLKVIDLPHCRAFLQVPLDEKFVKEHNGIHIDLPVNHLVAVYYAATSDASTIVYEQSRHDTKPGSMGVELTEHKRVLPVAGRVVIFDGARYHCSTQPRDGVRSIINYNFYGRILNE